MYVQGWVHRLRVDARSTSKLSPHLVLDGVGRSRPSAVQAVDPERRRAPGRPSNKRTRSAPKVPHGDPTSGDVRHPAIGDGRSLHRRGGLQGFVLWLHGFALGWRVAVPDRVSASSHTASRYPTTESTHRRSFSLLLCFRPQCATRTPTSGSESTTVLASTRRAGQVTRTARPTGTARRGIGTGLTAVRWHPSLFCK